MRYHLKLTKSCSYTGVISATKQNPDVYVEDKAMADKAVASGYFKLIEDAEDVKMADVKAVDVKAGVLTVAELEVLEDMTVSDLEAFALEKGISLKGVSKKADIIERLKGELDEEETENEVKYDDPSVTE